MRHTGVVALGRYGQGCMLRKSSKIVTFTNGDSLGG